MYRKLVLLLCLVILLSWSGTVLGETKETTLVIKIGDINALKDGYTQTLPAAARVFGGRTVVPLVVVNSLGFSTSWDEQNRMAIVKSNNVEIKLPIGQDFALINGARVFVDVPAQIIENRTFVPLRFISENLGSTVTWNASAQTVTIKSNLLSNSSPETTLVTGRSNFKLDKVLRTKTLPTELNVERIPQTAPSGSEYYIVYVTCLKINQPHLTNIGVYGSELSFITNANANKYTFKVNQFTGVQFNDAKDLFNCEFADGAHGFFIFEIPVNFVPSQFTLINTYKNTTGLQVRDSAEFGL